MDEEEKSSFDHQKEQSFEMQNPRTWKADIAFWE